MENGNTSAAAAQRAVLLDVAHQVDIRVVSMGAGEVLARLQQQRIARAQTDVPHLVRHAMTVAVYGDDGRIVAGAEIGVADALSDQGRRRRDDRLAQLPPHLARRDFVIRVGRVDETGDPLQLDDAAHDAGEDHSVLRLNHLLGRHRRDRRAAAIDLDQKQSRQLPQAGLVDSLADQSAAGLDLHFRQILPAALAQLLEQFLPFGEEPAADRVETHCPHHSERNWLRGDDPLRTLFTGGNMPVSARAPPGSQLRGESHG
jgi:hypothetical protein